MAIAELVVELVATLAAVGATVVARRAQGDSKRSADSSERSATAAEKSAEEARKTRLDALAPKVRVKTVKGVGTRWVRPDYPLGAPPIERPPDSGLALPGDNAHQIYLGAALILVNEGDTTADLHVTGWPQFDITIGDDRNPVSPHNDEAERGWSRGDYHLEPHSTVVIILREGPLLAGLVAAAGTVAVDVTATITDSQRVVRDGWVVHIEGQGANPIPAMAGDWRVAAWAETTPTITHLDREYFG